MDAMWRLSAVSPGIFPAIPGVARDNFHGGHHVTGVIMGIRRLMGVQVSLRVRVPPPVVGVVKWQTQ